MKDSDLVKGNYSKNKDVIFYKTQRGYSTFCRTLALLLLHLPLDYASRQYEYKNIKYIIPKELL